MTKQCTDDLRMLDVRRMARDGRLTPGQSFSWSWSRNGTTTANISIRVHADSVSLEYRHQPYGGEWQSKNYPVRLARTACNLGGERVWWHCPAAGCGRRVALLYLGRAGIFACRHCYRLAYRSQSESAVDRAIRPADKLREKLGWEAGILNGSSGKPKGMHWATYERLTASYYRHADRALAAMGTQLGETKKRLSSHQF